MEKFFGVFWEMTTSMGIFIVVGVMVAGILHELIPHEWISNQLGARNARSVFKATLFGIPLPLCSCSVIPFAAELKRKGSSEGAVISFLISTPITGIDSILATYGMFGWAFTFYRLFTSTIIAVAAGLVANWLLGPPAKAAPKFSFAPASSLNAVAGKPAAVQSPKNPFSLTRALYYGFVTLLGSIAKPLLWGLILGALVTMLIPENLSRYLSDQVWLGYLIAIVIAVPMYVCATASLPIAASMLIAGVSPGAAFVFLSAGPAASMVTMNIVRSMLGNKAMAIYLGSIVIGSVGFGVLLDSVWDGAAIREVFAHNESHGWMENAGAAVLLILIGYNLIQGRLMKQKGGCSGGSCCS